VVYLHIATMEKRTLFSSFGNDLIRKKKWWKVKTLSFS